MNRLFGRGKPKEPPPSITDCIAGVSMVNLLLEKQHSYFSLLYTMLFLVFISRKIYTIYAKHYDTRYFMT